MLYGYPVVLNLAGQRCVVVGGGPLAEEKALGLLDAGAVVTVIASELTPGLLAQCERGSLQWVKRRAQPGDLAGAFLAVAAEEDRSGNAALWEEAGREHVLFNALDDLPHCRFIYPSVLRRGALILAVSTSGVAPALAIRVRQRLGEQFGHEFERFLELAARWRPRMAQAIPDPLRRRELWYEIVDSDILELLRTGDAAAAESRLAAFVQAASVS